MDIENQNLEEHVRTLLIELMLVLQKHGINEIHLGGLLRLLGTSEEKAQESDDERLVLDEKFTKYMKAHVSGQDTSTVKKPRTLH